MTELEDYDSVTAALNFNRDLGCSYFWLTRELERAYGRAIQAPAWIFNSQIKMDSYPSRFPAATGSVRRVPIATDQIAPGAAPVRKA